MSWSIEYSSSTSQSTTPKLEMSSVNTAGSDSTVHQSDILWCKYKVEFGWTVLEWWNHFCFLQADFCFAFFLRFFRNFWFSFLRGRCVYYKILEPWKAGFQLKFIWYPSLLFLAMKALLAPHTPPLLFGIADLLHIKSGNWTKSCQFIVAKEDVFTCAMQCSAADCWSLPSWFQNL